MNIDDFLKQFIERYLLKDLASMANVTVPEGETGACGFSMVLVTLAGCELLGALTYSKAFKPSEGGDHFEHFWRNAMYPTERGRADLAPAIYTLVRHGLAHAFVTKPRILVTKNKGTKNHLCQAAGELTIDCLSLAEDFRAGYEGVVLSELRTGPGRSALQHQLNLMHKRYATESAGHGTRIDFLPVADPREAHRVLPSGESILQSNSPTLPARWKSEP